MTPIELIEKEILEQRNTLRDHELYSLLSEIEDVRVFMEKHVYAVWDFMSLLKALQNHLTCVSIPWKPRKNAKTARFINEIVHGEESDVNENGIPRSHFEMYLEAMNEVEANTDKALSFINSVEGVDDFNDKLYKSNLKVAEKKFLEFTFNVIRSNEIHRIASAFTFGREDLIPDIFIEIIEQSNREHRNRFPKLTYYLIRHIEVDGDEHGPLSLEMISELCGSNADKWKEVLETAKEALELRIHLWDEIACEIKDKKLVYAV
jgi:hypothetical protein